MSKIVTANLLATGAVVFLNAEGGWAPLVERARVFADDAEAEQGLAIAERDAAAAIVIDYFVTDFSAAEGGQPKMSLRDRIRAFGPTVKFHAGEARGREDRLASAAQ